MLAFEYPIRPFTFGPRSSPFFAMPYLAVGSVGPWAWVGVVGYGPLSALSRLGLFWRFGTFGLWGFTTTTERRTTKPGSPPLNSLVLRTENRQNFIANFVLKKKFWRQFFFGDFNKLRCTSPWPMTYPREKCGPCFVHASSSGELPK